MLATPSLRTRFARPSLEALEDRFSPATLSLNVSYGLGRLVTLHGSLTDTSTPGNQLITIQGVVNGQVVTDAAGNYSLGATPNYLGMVSAQKTDGSSNVASAPITDIPPTIRAFDAIEGPGNMWTLTGTLTYHRPFDTLTVHIGGVPVHINGRTTTADSTGAFGVAVQLDGTVNDNGSIWAEALSPWGLVSERAYEYIQQPGT